MNHTTLQELFQAQHDLQLSMPPEGRTPLNFESEEERIEFIRWNVLALTDELHEALNEVGWKPWATSRHVNEELFMKEMVDAFHFFMNLVMAGAPRGLDLETIVHTFITGYWAKRQVNRQRQEDGYDGVTAKCPSCKREKTAAVEIPEQGMTRSHHMCPCGYVWHEVEAGRLA